MLTCKSDGFNFHWKTVGGFKERQRNVRVAFAATSQCNRVISYCLTFDLALWASSDFGRGEMVCWPCWKFYRKSFDFRDFCHSHTVFFVCLFAFWISYHKRKQYFFLVHCFSLRVRYVFIQILVWSTSP